MKRRDIVLSSIALASTSIAGCLSNVTEEPFASSKEELREKNFIESHTNVLTEAGKFKYSREFKDNEEVQEITVDLEDRYGYIESTTGEDREVQMFIYLDRNIGVHRVRTKDEYNNVNVEINVYEDYTITVLDLFLQTGLKQIYTEDNIESVEELENNDIRVTVTNPNPELFKEFDCSFIVRPDGLMKSWDFTLVTQEGETGSQTGEFIQIGGDIDVQKPDWAVLQ